MLLNSSLCQKLQLLGCAHIRAALAALTMLAASVAARTAYAETAMRAYSASYDIRYARNGEWVSCKLTAIMDDLRVFGAPDDRTTIDIILASLRQI